MPNKTSGSRNKEPECDLSITYPDEPLAESVVYQDIFQKGYKRGYERGVRRGLQKGVKRMIERQLGALPLRLRRRIELLTAEQLEDLGLALLDFQTLNDVTRWLKEHATAPPTPN